MRQIILLLIFVLCKPINCESDSSEKENTSSECEETVMMNYLAEIEVTSPESLIEQSVADLETYCRRIYEQLEKFHKYFQTCKATDSQDLYSSLLNGARMLHKKLCDTPEFSRRFELYYPCMHDLRKDLDSCDGSADWYQDKDETQVCKNYKHIVDCYFIKVAKVCGIEAAKTLKELATNVVDSIITVKCSDICDDPNVKDPMPAKYLSGKALLDLMQRLDDFKNITNEKKSKLTLVTQHDNKS